MDEDDLGSLLDRGTNSPYFHLLFCHLLKDDRSALVDAERKLKKMVSCCQKCGVPGWEELLVYCRKCRIAAEHRYCLDKIPKRTVDVRWYCEDCMSKCFNVENSPQELVKVNTTKKESSLIIGEDPIDEGDECKFAQGVGMVVKEKRKLIIPDETKDARFEHGEGNEAKKQRIMVSAKDQFDRGKVAKSTNSKLINNKKHYDEIAQPLHDLSGLVDESSAVKSTQDKNENGLQLIVPAQSLPQVVAQEDMNIVARPIPEPIWSGYISFLGSACPFRGHLSTFACPKVRNAGRYLPHVLCMEVPRLDNWPNSYKTSPPTVCAIGLYFFSASTMVEPIFHQLLDDAVQKDLAFKMALGEADLLIFPSTLLPRDENRFQGQYYFWGVFRGRQAPVIASSSYHQHSFDDRQLVQGASFSDHRPTSPYCPPAPRASSSDRHPTSLSNSRPALNAPHFDCRPTPSTCRSAPSTLFSDCQPAPRPPRATSTDHRPASPSCCPLVPRASASNSRPMPRALSSDRRPAAYSDCGPVSRSSSFNHRPSPSSVCRPAPRTSNQPAPDSRPAPRALSSNNRPAPPSACQLAPRALSSNHQPTPRAPPVGRAPSDRRPALSYCPPSAPRALTSNHRPSPPSDCRPVPSKLGVENKEGEFSQEESCQRAPRKVRGEVGADKEGEIRQEESCQRGPRKVRGEAGADKEVGQFRCGASCQAGPMKVRVEAGVDKEAGEFCCKESP